MNFLYRLFLAFNATWLIVVVFLVKNNYHFNFLARFSRYYSWALFVIIPVALTATSFILARKLPRDNIPATHVTEIELANNSFLPTYLGYFFVSLGIEDVPTLMVVFGIIYIFTFLSQTLYFNPLFLLFGYHFYFFKTTRNVKIFIITKKMLKVPGEDELERLRRINDYTFIDL